MSDSELRLESLERRLRELENRLLAQEEGGEKSASSEPASGDRPLPAPPIEPKRLRPWLTRLHEAVGDLAVDQSDMHAQLAQILTLLEQQNPLGVATAAPRSAFAGPSQSADAARKVLRKVAGGARQARALGRRFWQSSAPADWIHRAPQPTPPSQLRLAVLTSRPLSGAWKRLGPQLAPRFESILWQQDTGDFHIQDSEGRSMATGQAHELAQVAEASQADICLRLGDLPTSGQVNVGILVPALDLMAVEELAFLHLRLPPNQDLLFTRWPWLDREGLNAQSLVEAPRTRVLGKSLGLGGLPRPPLPAQAAEKIRLFKGRWLAAKGPKKPIHHARHFGLPQGDSATEPAALAIILTRPIGGGLDRLIPELIAEEIKSAGSILLVQMADEGFEPAHPLISFCSTDGEPLTYPLADLFDPDDRPLALRLVLARHRPRRLLHIGPGQGLFDVQEALEELQKFDTFDHLPVPDPRFPGAEPTPPANARLLETSPETGEPKGLLPERQAARRRLGLPADAVVAAHIGDLGFDERPEDTLAALATLPEEARPRLLLAGRGPLAATLDDLARFYGLAHVVRCDASPEEALGACDFVISTAEFLPAPWTLSAAKRHGRPVIAVASEALETYRGDDFLLLEAGDLAALAEAISGQYLSIRSAES